MRQDWRKAGEQQRGDEGGLGPAGAQTPKIHHQRRDPEEHQVSGSAQGENAVVVRAAAQNPVAFVVGIRSLLEAFAGKIRSQRRKYTAEGRVHVFVEIPAGGEVLYACGESIGFVDGVVENGPSGSDSKLTGQNQHQREEGRPARGTHVQGDYN
jgi:hypothetical protein